ncbi:succinate dehydrogenase cytochrome b subunit, partial [Bacteroidota bacterium]
GFFLLAFLLVHLVLNSLLIFDDSGDLYNQGAHFMAVNPIIKIVEPVLAIGFILHMFYASILTIQNLKTRPKNYSTLNMGKSSTWASRNMYILGALILIFLAGHLVNFYWKIKFTGDPLLAEVNINGEHMENAYALVTGLFLKWKWCVALYVAGAVVLGLHLYHGFWSAFQTIGWSNKIWQKRLKVIGILYSLLIAGGYSFIPLWILIKSLI